MVLPGSLRLGLLFVKTRSVHTSQLTALTYELACSPLSAGTAFRADFEAREIVGPIDSRVRWLVSSSHQLCQRSEPWPSEQLEQKTGSYP